jgi:hypothetical protein
MRATDRRTLSEFGQMEVVQERRVADDMGRNTRGVYRRVEPAENQPVCTVWAVQGGAPDHARWWRDHHVYQGAGARGEQDRSSANPVAPEPIRTPLIQARCLQITSRRFAQHAKGPAGSQSRSRLVYVFMASPGSSYVTREVIRATGGGRLA